MSTQDTAARAIPLPIYLLTGFLGSGKTTLLSRLIHKEEFSDTAVIINEFGEVGLDHILVDQSTDNDIVLLDSGCLCCAMNSSLQESLESLYYRRLRGEIPSFSRVVIETSGLAEPSTIINTLAGDASVARHYYLASVITTVDAIHGLATMESFREAATQVAIADKLILTKTDLIEESARENVLKKLLMRNPLAQIQLSALAGSDDENIFFNQSRTPEDSSSIADQKAQKPSGRLTALAHVLKYGIASYVFHIPDKVSWKSYANWITYIQKHCGEQMLRVKGILLMEDGGNYAIHGVHHLFSPPMKLSRPIPAAQLGAVVMIAQNLSREDLSQSFTLLCTETNDNLATPIR